MAQKRDKEETELKVPETLICAAPISAPPKLSAAVDDQISKTAAPSEISDLAPDQMILMASVTEGHRSRSARSPERPDLASAFASASASPSPPPRQPQAAEARRSVNRCAGCKRKVGLTGFRCRCGEMFCSVHRYSDRHDCSFDYKAAGREAIARENPVVRAAKILKV